MAYAIEVDNLAKVYRLNKGLPQGDRDLRQTLTNWLLAPWRRLRGGAAFGAGETEEFWALRGLSFDVPESQVLGVIGRNGAGKSTLLKILSRIAEPSSGRALIRGRVSSLLEVGTGFHQELTGRENIFLNGAILGMSRREIARKLDEIVEFSGVEKFLDTPVKRYSSGMRVRLGFAVAAHLEPDILIIDEVLAVGDAGFQRKCLGKMDNIAKGGRTILFVSHNMAAVRTHCTKGLLLEAGRIEAWGHIDDVVDRYNQLQGETLGDWRESLSGDTDFGDDFVLRYATDGGMVSIDCGEPITLSYTIEAPRKITGVTSGITIRDRSGDPVMGMSSKVQAIASAEGDCERWSVRVDLGRIPLNAGTYSATIFVGDQHRDVARFSHAFTLVVREHDVFGWGNALPSATSWGHVFWSPQWQIEPVEASDCMAG